MWWSQRPSHASAVALLAWSALVRHAAAQVTTDCFPMNKTCPADPAFGMDYNFNFNSTPNVDAWETTVGPVTWDSQNGATFTINKQGDSPTIRTQFYFFWGRTEVHLKTAKGTGIVSSVMMLSDNLDEVDWEFLGTNDTTALTNYFGKGVQDYHNGGQTTVAAGTQDDFHNYTIDWTKEALNWYIDGTPVRTLLPKDANNTYYYPQTPMRLSIGIWAGGDPRLPNGTRQWAGGDTDYSKGPFTMYVKSARITDYSNGSEYQYSDKSGSWESIKVVSGNSTIKTEITAPPAETLADKWNKLPNGAKIAVYASAAGVGGLLLFAAMFYCIRQRRRGAREAKAAEARAEAERLELERFKKAGVDPDSFVTSASEYNANDMRREGLTDKDSYSVPSSPSLHAMTPASPLDGNRWDASAAALGSPAVAGMRSPMPLLRDGAQSPRIASPAPLYSDRTGNNRSPAPGGRSYPGSPGGAGGGNFNNGTRSPAPSRYPGGGPSSPASPHGSMRSPTQQNFPQPNRSFSSPNAQMRRGSPAPSQQNPFGDGMQQRSASPAQLAHPQPQRSFTTGGYGGAAEQGSGYGNGNGGGGAGQGGYWGNGGGYR